MSGVKSFINHTMEKQNKPDAIRNFRNGDWFWIQREVLRKHAPQIGITGLAVYCFLASMTNDHQTCFPSQKHLAGRLNCSRATVNKTIKRLVKTGLIRIEKRGHYHCLYTLLEIRCKAQETQMSNKSTSDVNQFDTNDNNITRINNDIDKLKIKNSKSLNPKRFKPQTKEALLALDLAETLDDLPGLPLYLSLTKKYPEPFLRRALSEVKEIPADKIKKSRGAYFNYLVQKHAQKAA